MQRVVGEIRHEQEVQGVPLRPGAQRPRKLVRQGKAHARKLLYARILPKADEGGPACWTDE